jgi:hypothetical protein
MPPQIHLSSRISQYLADLEDRIDPQDESHLLKDWIVFSEGRFPGQVFTPTRSRPTQPTVEWPQVSINSALNHFEGMAFQQFSGCSTLLESGSGLLLNIRCNYGTGIMPSLFGAPIFVMGEEYNTLPTSVPLNDLDAIKRLLDAGVPDLQRGYGRQVFEMAEYFLSLTQNYPKISQFVSIYHPDTQGPMDICELIWGSSIFYALYDFPDLVKGLLELVVATYIEFMRLWEKYVPFRKVGNVHWGLFHKGSLMLRDDSAMNLSAEMFQEFVMPYDQRLLDEFGGGAIHFCGKGEHYIHLLSQIKGLNAVNLTQPEYNDMEIIYTNTVDRGINLLDLRQDTVKAAVSKSRDLHGRVHSQ